MVKRTVKGTNENGPKLATNQSGERYVEGGIAILDHVKCRRNAAALFFEVKMHTFTLFYHFNRLMDFKI